MEEEVTAEHDGDPSTPVATTPLALLCQERTCSTYIHALYRRTCSSARLGIKEVVVDEASHTKEVIE